MKIFHTLCINIAVNITESVIVSQATAGTTRSSATSKNGVSYVFHCSLIIIHKHKSKTCVTETYTVLLALLEFIVTGYLIYKLKR